jgi:integrase
MRGSVKVQAGNLIKTIDRRGTSKSRDLARVAQEIRAESKIPTSTELAARTGVYSNGTREGYFGKIRELGQYMRDEFGEKDLSRVTPEMVKSFLEGKVEEQLSLTHWQGYASAFSKLDQAIAAVTGQPNERVIKNAIDQIRHEAHAECPRFDGRDRAYIAPDRLIAAMPDQAMQIAARLQRENGLRIAEATRVDTGQLRPDGSLHFVAKGGQHLSAALRPETRAALSAYLQEHGSLQVDPDHYRSAIRTACEQTGERYEASHGLRYNFAQEKYRELRDGGMGRLEALGAVAEEMGHHRTGITSHYLAGQDN